MVEFDRFAEKVSHRTSLHKKFNKNSEAYRNAFERGSYDEVFAFACACEEAGRDWPDNEMFWGGGRFMKAFAAEIAGDYDAVSASYEAYKSGKLIEHKRGCVVTSEPRLAYKQGKTDEAFRGYCDFSRWTRKARRRKRPQTNRRVTAVCVFRTPRRRQSFAAASEAVGGKASWNGD